MAIVAEGDRRRVYLAAATTTHRRAADVEHGRRARPRRAIRRRPSGFRVQNYGLTQFSDLFTDRQLLALTTFSDLVMEARERVLRDALAGGAPAGDRLESGGTDGEAYADAVATYLGLAGVRRYD